MQSKPRMFVHLLERSGLAIAGAAGGLFVGAHVGSSIAGLTTGTFLIVMMFAGALGAYFGIDTPPHRFRAIHVDLPGDRLDGSVDTTELLTATGTLLAASTAFLSVALIVFGRDTHIYWTVAIMLGWAFGVLMQIVAGAIARARA